MKNFYHHTSFLVLSIATTALVSLLYAYIVISLNKSVDKTLLTKNQVKEMNERAVREKDMARIYEQTANERKEISRLFVPINSSLEFIEAIEELGKQSGSKINLSSINTDNSVATTTMFSNIEAHVDVIGSWNAVMKTLVLAELMPYITTVDKVRLETSFTDSDKSASHSWRMSFNIKAKTINSEPL